MKIKITLSALIVGILASIFASLMLGMWEASLQTNKYRIAFDILHYLGCFVVYIVTAKLAKRNKVAHCVAVCIVQYVFIFSTYALIEKGSHSHKPVIDLILKWGTFVGLVIQILMIVVIHKLFIRKNEKVNKADPPYPEGRFASSPLVW